MTHEKYDKFNMSRLQEALDNKEVASFVLAAIVKELGWTLSVSWENSHNHLNNKGYPLELFIGKQGSKNS